jgi:fatty-acid desaturase
VLAKLRYLRGSEPLPRYDALDADEVVTAVESADLHTITLVREYEMKFHRRDEVLTALVGGLLTLVWAGLVRIFLLHHATFSINSICHYFGRRRFATHDESTNVGWLALATFGESWHNNHHAFPTSAFHGLRRAELDLGGHFIRTLERLGLAWDVVRVSPERQRERGRPVASPPG